MKQSISRRELLQSGSVVGLSTLWPSVLWADIKDIPRSDYGFATTADEVAAGIDLSGKTVLITGCNSGLGYESMRVMTARVTTLKGAEAGVYYVEALPSYYLDSGEPAGI